MHKKILISTTLAVIILLAGFSCVANARIDLIEQIKDTRSDIPDWLQFLLAILMDMIWPIIYGIFYIFFTLFP